MKLDKIEVVGEHKVFQIREIADSGEYFRRMIVPSMDVSGEVQDIQDKAGELWTNEVKSAWSTSQAEKAALAAENE